jgi:hypothetical protein
VKELLEKEIQVVETLISQLNACLALYHKKHMHNEFRITFADIQLCREELKKLMAAKEAEKGVSEIETVERSGTSIL